MATYKVLQDIESEDKLIGPLTFKQFVFAIITFGFMGVAFLFSKINIFLVIPWLIPIFLFGFMASPIGKDQPNDVWLAARLRFMIKPRLRRWDQSGMQELVTITVPKKIEIDRTNHLTQHEVKSRLNALANTLDSRGWAIKTVSTEMFNQPGYINGLSDTERLIDISSMPVDTPIVDIQASEDILDAENNSIAQRFEIAIKEKQKQRIDNLKNSLQTATKPEQSPPKTDYSFIAHQGEIEPGYVTFGTQVINPGKNNSAFEDIDTTLNNKSISTTEEEFLKKRHQDLERQHSEHYRGNDHIIIPISEEVPNPISSTTLSTSPNLSSESNENLSTNQNAPNVILKELSQNSAGLSVSSVASLANRANQEVDLNNNDTISLH